MKSYRSCRISSMPTHTQLKRIVLWLLGLSFLGGILALGILWWRHNREVILPLPDGPYPVGRVEYDWTDTDRFDPTGTGAQQHRTLNVWIWYPADRDALLSQRAPYLPDAWLAAREQDIHVGSLLTQNQAHVSGHSLAHPPLASDQATYPLVIMQPGLGPLLADYTTLAESLASHGYIVAGSTPTGSASVVVFNSGQVVPGTPQGNVAETATISETQRV